MPLVMLRPNWPSKQFHRTIRTYSGVGKKRTLKSERVVQFTAAKPVEVSDDELETLRSDIGVALFECELDEKSRPRLVESVPPPAEATTATAEPPAS